MARRKSIVYKSKKKEAVAQATVRKGTGIVRVNSRNLDLFEPRTVQEFIKEPLQIAGEKAREVNITVKVHGSGAMSQAVATRASIAKSLVGFIRDKTLQKKMLQYDRMLLVDDPRRTEPKKPLGPKARRKKQHSKR
jgi:small subunit ribosomal protein S9